MKSIERLLATFFQKGVRLWIEQGELLYKGPKGVLTAEDIAELRAWKNEIIRFLGDSKTLDRQVAPLTVRSKTSSIPLSFAQERLWFLDQLGLVGTTYNMPEAIRLQGELNVEVLERCFIEVVRRHESLRTRFKSVDGTPVQIIDEASTFKLERVDLSEIDTDAHEKEVERLAQEGALQKFDMEKGPLFWVQLLKISSEEHVLLVTMHHIISDGWSMGILIRELSALYGAFSQGRASPLKELPVQYADYALWQRELMQGEVLERQLAYWRKQLLGAPPALELPTDRPRPAVASFKGAVLPFSLSPELSAALIDLGRREGATPFMVMLAAFQVLLSRWSGQNDIVVGSPIAGRTHPNAEELIGFFVNTLVFRTTISDGQQFLNVLEKVKTMTLDAYAHQDIPFEKLVAEFQPERNLAYQPIFQVAFAWQNFPRETLSLSKLRWNTVAKEHASAKFDLLLFMQEARGELQGMFEYATDLFERDSIERLMEHLKTLLKAVVNNPQRIISELPLLSSEAHQELLAQWNQSRVVYPAAACLHNLFSEQAHKTPYAIALVCEKGKVTYRDLDERSNQLAHYLKKHNLGSEAVVGLLADRSIDMVVGIVAILKAGMAYLPLDPSYPPERLAFMLEDARTSVVLVQDKLANTLPPVSGTIISMDGQWREISKCPKILPRSDVIPENLAYMIYTSGSTGKPKGVMVSHKCVTRLFAATKQYFSFSDRDTWTLFHSYAFDFSVWELWGALLHGGRLVIVPFWVSRSPELFYDLVCNEEVTVLNQTPSAFSQFSTIDEKVGHQFRLRLVIFGGEALNTKELRGWFERHNEGEPQLINMYGITETTVHVTYHAVRQADVTHANASAIGKPISDLQAYVLDERLNPVPVGVPGELFVGGEGLARGYWKRSGLTAQRFIANPHGEAGSRLYRTGDLVRHRQNGDLEYLGRIDQQVKIRGFRIELGEIETALLQTSLTNQVAVIAREDQSGDKRLVAYVVEKVQGMERDEVQETALLKKELVDQWEELYNDTYSERAAIGEPSFVGWLSSYTGEPIAEEHMQEWLRGTIERIQALNPQKILEIGCGVGLLLQHLALSCQTYKALDFSAQAITGLRRWIETRPDLKHVDLYQRTAIELDDQQPGSVDTVILNSVIQYFPDADYLLEVLTRAMEITAPNGRIFVGDVRHLGLLPVFHSSIQVAKSSPDATVGQLKDRISRAIAHEKELVIDPEWFLNLPYRFSRIAAVDVQLKRGHFQNELTGYRYDVVLHMKGASIKAGASQNVLEWQPNSNFLKKLRTDITELRPASITIRNIKNIRLTRDLAAAQLIQASEDTCTIERIRQVINSNEGGGENPQDFWDLGDAAGYEVNVTWSVGSRGESFDVEMLDLQRVSHVEASERVDHIAQPLPRPDTHATTPLLANHRQRLITRLREHLVCSLPEYMVPSAFVVLESLPLTANGKLDRSALPRPDWQADLTTYIDPRTQVEKILVKIWSEVLKLDRVGIKDNFFELGGHSLLATRVVAQLREALKVELPLRALFETPTLEELAQRIDHLQYKENETLLPSIYPRNREKNVPLSFSQERFWFLDKLNLVGAAYNMPAAIRLQGELNVEVLEQCFIEVVRRHESLRTRFKSVDGTPVQIIDEASIFKPERVDLSELDPNAREKEVERLAQKGSLQKFDMEKGPLFWVQLLKVSPEEHVLLVTMHHIISDGWSIGILIRELSSLYDAFLHDRVSPLEELPIQYADYALWQREWMQGEVLERQLAYWRKQLLGAPPALELPTDRPRPAVASFKGAVLPFSLSPELSAALIDLGRREGATPFMVMLAAFQVLLSRWSGQKDIVVGSPIAGRTHGQSENVIGLFLNTLAFRTRLNWEASFRSILNEVKRMTLDAYAHQDVPFEKLVAEFQPERDLSRQPVFQVLLSMQNMPQEQLQLPGLKFTTVSRDHIASKFDVTLFVHETPDGFAGACEYAIDLFDRSTIERLLRNFMTLLHGITENADVRIWDLPLLSNAERKQILVDWNATALQAAEDDCCLHHLFGRQAQLSPEAVAVIYETQKLSYREIDERSNQLANYLQSLGVGPEVVVGLCVKRGPDMVLGLLGILKAGGAYLPLDPAYPSERLAHMLADAGVAVLLTHTTVDSLPAHWAREVHLDISWPEISKQSSALPSSLVDADNLAYLIYTSGSTGKPKGVMISHRSVVNYIEHAVREYRLTQGFSSPVNTPLSFDATVTSLLAPLAAGGAVHLLHEGPEELAELGVALAESAKYSLVKITPAHLAALQQAHPKSTNDQAACALIIGGENLSAEQIALWRKHAPNTRLINEYGPTETVVGCATYEANDATPHVGSVPIGRPIANTKLYVLDERWQPVPIGVVGELFIGGVGLARGYAGKPSLTARYFVANPFDEDGGRLYRTGDFVRYLQNGDLEFLGRGDHQVKLRGYRIELAEIESALSSHAGVYQAVVTLREDLPGDKRLIAYVVPRDRALKSDEIQDHLQRHLPSYMIPSRFIFLDELRLTPNGKIDRAALPVPGNTAKSTSDEIHTESEEVLISIWGDVLGIDQIGIHDNFFEAGGHSLLATRVVALIREAFGVELPLRVLFESPTIAELCEQVELMRSGGINNLRPELTLQERGPRIPLSYAQERLWLLDNLDMGGAYIVPAALRVSGRVNVEALRHSFEEILRRHESLRTHFEVIDGQACQIIDPAGELAFEVKDLSLLEEEQKKIALKRLLNEELHKQFVLEKGPLFRVTLINQSTDDHVLFVAMHHIVSDGWSMGVMIRELSLLYGSFSQDLPSPLSQPALQYADYALWQRSWLQGEALERQLEYWRRQLAGAPATLDLPTDRRRPSVASFSGANVSFRIPIELSTGLIQLSRQEGATPFMAFLAAFQLLLSRYSGQEDVVVGVPIAGRTHRQVENLIGFFVNTLVMRTNLSKANSFRDLLRLVRTMTLDAHAHQDIPFEKLVAELRPERDLSRQPIFQVMLVLQNAPEEHLNLTGLELSPIDLGSGEGVTAKFDLTLYLRESANGYQATFEYATDLFERDSIERLKKHFIKMLRNISEKPDVPLTHISSLPPEEHQDVLFKWNDTATDYPRDKCVHQLFASQATRSANDIAVSFERRELTYRELDERSNQLAHYLRSRGVGPEVVVGLCAERSIEMVIGLLATMKAGGVYLPLDPSHPPERLSFMLEDAKVAVLLVQERWLDQLPAYHTERILLNLDWPVIVQYPSTMPPNISHPKNLVYAIYTSGSTGQPKAVAATHAALASRIFAQPHFLPFDSSDISCQKTSISFVDSIAEILLPLIAGHKLVVAAANVGKDPEALMRLIESEGITRLISVPSLARTMVQSDGARQKLRTLRSWTLSGEALTSELHRNLMALLPECAFVNLYGCSEVGADATCYTDAVLNELTVPIGKPLANMQVYVLDDRLMPVPIGVLGELYVGGEGLARGYLSKAELTAARFIGNPFGAPGSRIYRTGDICRRLADGNLLFIGRADDQVKIRGHRIELGEVSTALLKHPKIRQAAVVAQIESSEERRLVAYISVRGESVPTSDELRQHLRLSLPDYMVPSLFVVSDELPFNSSGKIDRLKLLSLKASLPSRESAAAPRTAVQEALVKIWKQILRIEHLGIQENFFDVGGHSLLATRVVSQVRELFGVKMKLREIFEVPTIEQLSEKIEDLYRAEGRPQSLPVLIPQARDSKAPLSLSQEQFYILDVSHPQRDAKNVVLSLRYEGAVNALHLSNSVQELVNRHEILRTRFEVIDGHAHQVIHDGAGKSYVEVHDLTDASPSDKKTKVAEITRLVCSTKFDVKSGPLFKLHMIQLAAEEHVLLLAAHRLIADSWSMEVLSRELSFVYIALMNDGSRAALPEIIVQYADYAIWQRLWISEEVLKKAALYWRDWWSDKAPFQLVPENNQQSIDKYEVAEVRLNLSEVLSTKLLSLARSEKTTPYILLLSAFKLFLSFWSGKSDVIVGSPITGREQWQTQRLVGTFERTLMLQASINRGAKFSEFMRAVESEASRAHKEQTLSLAECMSVLRAEPDISCKVTPQVMFIWKSIPQLAELRESKIRLSDIQHITTCAGLSLCVKHDAPKPIDCAFEYEKTIFEQHVVEGMRAHFICLLDRIVAEPSAAVGDLFARGRDIAGANLSGEANFGAL